jgi:hypothetical protein
MTGMFLMKSNCIFLFWFMIFGSYSYGQNLECKRFTNGSFKIVDSEMGTSFIRRNGARQSEITEGKKDSTTFIVKWIDDCTYTLTPTKKTRKNYPSLPENATLTVKIIETKDNSYIQTSTSNFSDIKATNEVIKVQ